MPNFIKSIFSLEITTGFQELFISSKYNVLTELWVIFYLVWYFVNKKGLFPAERAVQSSRPPALMFFHIGSRKNRYYTICIIIHIYESLFIPLNLASFLIWAKLSQHTVHTNDKIYCCLSVSAEKSSLNGNFFKSLRFLLCFLSDW